MFYPVPFDVLLGKVSRDVRLRRRVRNMLYDGVLSRLLGVDLDEMEAALRRQFGGKPKVVAINREALDVGYAYADEHLEKRDPFFVEPMSANRGRILVEGNAAAAIGCMMAGVTVVTWYPITPSSSLCETLIDYLRKYRVDGETGKATFAVVQAEDEIAALGMALGGGWAGGPLDDRDVGAGNLADGRVRGARLLRGGARGHLRHPAGGAVDGSADPHRPRATCCRPRFSLTGTPGIPCCFPARRKSATRWRWMPSISPNGSRRRSSC